MTGIDVIIGIVGLGFVAMLGIIVWHIFEDILWNIVNLINAILTTQKTGNVEVRAIRKIKPEEDHNSTMVVEIFAH